MINRGWGSRLIALTLARIWVAPLGCNAVAPNLMSCVSNSDCTYCNSPTARCIAVGTRTGGSVKSCFYNSIAIDCPLATCSAGYERTIVTSYTTYISFDVTNTWRCTLCAAGYISSAGGVCTACTSFKTSDPTRTFCACQPGYEPYGDNSCSACAYGYGSNFNGPCYPCPVGMWSTYFGTPCINCLAGTYSASTGTISCDVCVAGKYADGISPVTACTTCTAGKYALSAAGSCTPCVAGKFSTATGAVSETACQQCEVGTFSASAGLTVCTNCTVSGTYQPNRGGTSCPACLTGTYQTGVRQAVCLSCPAGTYNALTGKTSIAFCLKCQAGKYQQSTEKSTCGFCLAGTYTNRTGSISCDACELGKYQTGTGMITCPNCTAGRFAGVTGMAQCSACGAGFYQANVAQSACQPCATGSYLTGTGWSVCTACPAGSAMNRTNATACTVCAAGKSQGLSGQAVCRTCESGKYQPRVNTSACQNCEAGYANGLSGDAWDALGQAPSCAPCGLGKYGGTTGMSACAACGEDTFQNVTGTTVCRACTPNYYSNVGQTVCSSCARGTYQVWGVGCLQCELSKYQPGRGRTMCEVCPVGKFTGGNGSQSLEDCVLCSPGTYVAPGMQRCETCAAGKFQTAFSGSGCLDCSAGEYASQAGWGLPCVLCAPGTFQNRTGASACVGCRACGDGMYRLRGCDGVRDTLECKACQPGCGGGDLDGQLVQVRACSETSDMQCGKPGYCLANRTSAMRVPEWLDYAYRCHAGQYLWGFDTAGPSPTCRTCPPSGGLAGINGVLCEACGPLEEPYYTDRSSCVCRLPAVMNASGACECPAGFFFNVDAQGVAGCRRCERDTYSMEGGSTRCWPCGAGRTTGGTGATACDACAFGSFRVANTNASGCQNCSGRGQFAPDPASSVCAQCDQGGCALRKGWRWKQACPTGGSNYSVCEPCPGGLPDNATWTSVRADPVRPERALEECAFDCLPGYYHADLTCVACNASRVCPAGRKFTGCSAWADSHCDVECSDPDRPLIYSHWVAGDSEASQIGCQWECDAGRSLVVSDYGVFVLRECL